MWRLSRIRFVVIRSCILSIFIILILQIFGQSNNQESLSRQYRNQQQSQKYEEIQLSEIERINRIKLFEKQFQNDNLNWTKLFFDSYKRKLAILNERDSKTKYKQRFRLDENKNVTQNNFPIYLETKVFQQPKFCSKNQIFHPQCPFQNCQLTCTKPTDLNTAQRHASIFHFVDIEEEEIRKKLTYRSANDIWILWEDEANQNIRHLNQYNFNWTLSFRLDSEISIGSYGFLIEQQQRQKSYLHENSSELFRILTNANIEITNLLLEHRIYTNFRYRSKHALWFVSNCVPQRRLNYYKNLKNYYPIKAFGSCGEYKCEKDGQCQSEQSYLALFYLAFESQQCLDYVTEKFWRALYYGMIPIVLGPPKQSYLDLGIPSSAYIHVDEYQSERELGNQLHLISTDYLLYRKYFLWLDQYDTFYDINVLEPIRMCELCMRLNLQDFQDHSYYTNIHNWLAKDCLR